MTVEAPEELLARLYEGPLEDEPWLGFLQALRARLDAVAVNLALRLPEPHDPGFDIADSDWDVRALRQHYAGDYFAEDPFGYEVMTPGRLYAWQDFVDPATFRASRYYREFCRPVGFEYAVCLAVGESPGPGGWLRLARSRRGGDFDAADRKLLERLAPHLERALALYARIQRSESERAAYLQAVEQLDIGTLLLDRQGRVLSVSRKARAILADQPAFDARGGRLRTPGRANGELDEALEAIRARPEPDNVRALSLDREGASPIGVLLRPLPGDQARMREPEPAVIVYVTDPGAHHLAPGTLVAHLFGLTAAEARLATLLADGLTLVEAAERMRISEGSARSYCKRIFARTGVKRQAELVRLILRSVAPLAAES